MDAMFVPAIIAVTLIAACSVGLLRRRSSGPLRLCFLTMGLMGVTQGGMMVAPLVQAPPAVMQLLQLLLAGLSLHVLYLLGMELYERNNTQAEKKVEVVVGEGGFGQASVSVQKGLRSNASRSLVDTPTDVGELQASTLRATADLLLLLGALTASSEPVSPALTVRKYVGASREK